MTAVARACAVALATTLLVAGCTGSDPDGSPTADPDPSPPTAAAEDGGASTGVAGGVVLAPGAQVDVAAPLLEVAATWIAEESGLTAMLQEELALERASRTRDVVHLVFIQQHDEVAVRGAQFVVHVRDADPPEVLGASQSLTTTLPAADAAVELDEEAATEIAIKAVPGTVADVPEVTATWVEAGTDLRLGWDVRITTADPPLGYSVVVDATTAEVLSVDQLTSQSGHGGPGRPGKAGADVEAAGVEAAGTGPTEVAQAGCDAPAPPSACIFVVDPIYASGDPAISPTRANGTLVGVPLPNLLDPSSPDLIGRYAAIAPEVAAAYAAPDGVWGEGGRGGDGTFEAGMTYYWIDYAQQLVQEMGFDIHADDPVEFVPIEPAFPDNAFYLFTEDRIHMGAAADGVNEAEDAQGILHEYGHALLQAAVPDILSEEGGAIHESVGDLVSVFTTLEFRNGDIGCLFHWAEQGRCLRRIDTDLVYPDDLRFEVHLDGEILNGAVWDTFRAVLARDTGLSPEDCQDRATNPCDAARDQVYGTLLGSFAFLTPQATLADAASAFAVSDQTFYGGANAAEVEAAFAAHGLPTTGTPAVQVQVPGLMDFERSDAVVAVKIDHEYRGDLAVRLQVVGADGGRLCQLDLVQPDPQDAGDEGIVGRFDVTDTECGAFLPPGPDQVWRLTAIDTAPEDSGRLTQFAVGYQGRRFAATGLPADIPDADEVGVTAAVGGGGDAPTAVAEDDMAAPEGSVVLDLAITHPYRGDLQVQLAVIDAVQEVAVCRVDVLAATPADDGDDVDLQADVGECGALFPPTPARPWVLQVADLGTLDEGAVTLAALTGPDGTRIVADLPDGGRIPDADPEGLLLILTG